MVLLLVGRAWAAPEPPPPVDFPGAQYIDRTGCVFLRDGTNWVARLDKTGAPICGFPPSMGAEPAAAADPSRPAPEEVLSEMLAQGLREGDLATQPVPAPLAVAPPDPGQAVLNAELQDQLAAERRVRSVLAGSAPLGLCERLGYRPGTGVGAAAVGDVTQGLCPGMTAPQLAPVTVAGQQPLPQALAPASPKPEPKAPVVAAVADPVPDRKDKPAPREGATPARQPAVPVPPRTSSAEIIPPHARYVEIGVYADGPAALAALRRLSDLGFRTAQRDQTLGDKPGKAILAGPFADRQGLVRALNRLRATGYPGAVPR